MKQKTESGAHDRLSELLHTWEVEPELPIDFESEVWHQIERSRKAREAPVWLLCDWIERVNNPVIAGGLATAVVVMSLMFGAVQSHLAGTRAMEELQGQYVAFIDPLARSNEWEVK